MQTVLNAPENPARGAYSEKKSEFIGEACHAGSLEEALDFVQSVRSRNPKARHVAYAAVVGDSSQAHERMSDDGEPAGTAGRPVLNVLRQSGLTGCVIAVTRYFGGILLGSGGLIRAYSSAASAAVAGAELAGLVPAAVYETVIDYPSYSQLKHCITQSGGIVREERFTEKVRMVFAVASDRTEEFSRCIDSAFRHAVTLDTLEESYITVPVKASGKSEPGTSGAGVASITLPA
ncbi:MAG: IMPACT family protein [Scardovia wiggsiae]